MIQHKMTR